MFPTEMQDELRSIVRIAMPLSLRVIFLCKLCKGDAHGYELMKYATCIYPKGFPIKISASQVYPLLHELRSQGYILMKREGRRKIYSITPAGRSRARHYKALFDMQEKNNARIKRELFGGGSL